MPRGVALTRRSASPTSSGRPARATRAGQRHGLGGRLRGAVDHDDRRAPACASARTTARAAPPAPEDGHRPAGEVEALVDLEGVDEPGPVGVVAHAARPPRRCTQFTAPRASASAREPVERGEDGRLVGHGDRQPFQAEGPHAAHGQAGGAFRHLEGQVGPVEAAGGERGVEDGRRQRVADRQPDHAGRARVARDAPLMPSGTGSAAARGRGRRTAPWPAGTRCSCR